jgi:hypothetical protein
LAASPFKLTQISGMVAWQGFDMKAELDAVVLPRQSELTAVSEKLSLENITCQES